MNSDENQPNIDQYGGAGSAMAPSASDIHGSTPAFNVLQDNAANVAEEINQLAIDAAQGVSFESETQATSLGVDAQAAAPDNTIMVDTPSETVQVTVETTDNKSESEFQDSSNTDNTSFSMTAESATITNHETVVNPEFTANSAESTVVSESIMTPVADTMTQQSATASSLSGVSSQQATSLNPTQNIASANVGTNVDEIITNSAINQTQPVMASPKPKKHNIALTILLVVLALVLMAGIGLFVWYVIASSKNVATTVPNNNYVKPADDEIALVCTNTWTEEELALRENVVSYTTELIANYLNGSLVDISDKTVVTYSSEEVANDSVTGLRNEWSRSYNSAGFQTDPFLSEYTPKENTVTVSHYADANILDEKSAILFDLSANSEGEVMSDIGLMRKIRENLGYTCRRSDEPTESEDSEQKETESESESESSEDTGTVLE